MIRFSYLCPLFALAGLVGLSATAAASTTTTPLVTSEVVFAAGPEIALGCAQFSLVAIGSLDATANAQAVFVGSPPFIYDSPSRRPNVEETSLGHDYDAACSSLLIGRSPGAAAPLRIVHSRPPSSELLAAKAINLPAWRKVTVDTAHIAERHISGGPLTAGRTVFPSTMNEKGVIRAIRDAYQSSTKVGVQGADRIKLVGEGAGLKIEMWFNKATNTIETAYPITP